MRKILCTGVMMVLTGLCSDGAEVVNPWVTSAATPYGQPIPNVWSVESLHADPAFAGLTPKAFCNVYYDGRRKKWEDYEAGLTLWSHSPQQPFINAGDHSCISVTRSVTRWSSSIPATAPAAARAS